MNTNGHIVDPARAAMEAAVLRAGQAALCLQAEQLMTQVVAALRGGTWAAATQSLTELAGALALAGEQGLAALVERLRDGVLSAGADGGEGASWADRALRLRVELRHGLERSLRGQALRAADLLPAWRELALTDDASDAAPLLSLQVDERFAPELPGTLAEPVGSLVQAEHALLEFLRAPDSIGRREAASTFARVLAGAAAATDDFAIRRLWLVLHAYVDELAAGNFADLARTKPILAHVLRALRHRNDACLPSCLAPLARQALFELAQSPPLSAAGRQVALAFRLEQQLSPSMDVDAVAGPEPLAAADQGFISRLALWIAAREANVDGLGPVEEWRALAESGRQSGRFVPLAEPLERLVGRWSGLQAVGTGESVAAAMLCLQSWAAAHSCSGADALRMADLLDLAADDGKAARPALQAMARLLGHEPLMGSLVAACGDVMDTGERLLDGGAIEHDGAQAIADVRRLLEAMSGAMRLLALDALLPLAGALCDQLDDFLISVSDGDDGGRQAFARHWVMLADEIAMLPWTVVGPAEPTEDLTWQGDQEQPGEPRESYVQDLTLPLQATDEALLVDPLAAIFLEEARGLLALLRATLLPDDAEVSPAAAADALHAAHTLAGCAVTVGLPAMGRLAQALESQLESVSPASPLFGDPATMCEVLDTLDSMIVEFAETGACGDADTLATRLHAGSTTSARVPDEWQDAVLLPQDASRCSPADADGGSLMMDGAIAAVDATDRAAHELGDNTADISADAGVDALVTDAAPPSLAAQDDELLAIFWEEAADLLPQLEQALHAWQQSPDDRAAPTPLLRILHTLKGSARMAGQMAWGDELHRCESEVGVIARLAPVALGERLSALQAWVDEWRHAWCGPPAAVPCAISSGIVDSLPEEVAVESAGGAPLHETSIHEAAAASPQVSPAAQQLAAQPAAARASSSSLLRVRAEIFTTFADAVAELWVGHARLADGVQQQRRAVAELADTLARLRAQVRELEIDAESRIVSVAAPSDDKGFDPLEFDRYTRLHEITRMIAESAADLGDLQRSLMRQGDGLARAADAQVRELRSLQSSLQAVRSQSFGTIEARLRHVVRQAARESGREADCAITGASVEVDRSLLDRLAGPLEHVLRNAVVHGIEPPAERAAIGKPRVGRISLSVLSSATELRLEIADDGGGLDLERIRDRAFAVGLLTPQAEQGPQTLSDLIFQPGFSTASEVTALAGRGIGLDAVRSALQALGGRISVDSQAGQGCRFTICVPLALATLPVLLVRAGRHRIGLPAPRLQQLLQLKPGDSGHEAGSRMLMWEGVQVPLADLGHLLGEPPQPAAPGARVPVAVLRESGRLLALRLDAVEGQRELVVKSPGPQLSSVPGLAGASVLGDGSIALIVDPFRLEMGEQAIERAPAAPVRSAAGPLVLVVDDSLTIRRASQRLLERHGYEVALARDGIEGLALLRERRPAAVLLDIEMPRMDGFELLAAVRNDPQLRELAVVMITSRIADRHRQRAQQLGVSGYMGKPFREEELVSLLAGLCRSTAGEQDEGRMEKQSRSERPEAAA